MLELSFTHKDQSEDRIEMRTEGEVEPDSEARVIMRIRNFPIIYNIWGSKGGTPKCIVYNVENPLTWMMWRRPKMDSL